YSPSTRLFISPRTLLSFFNETATAEIYTLSLHDALPISRLLRPGDLLLVDGELYAGDATMAGYDNPLNRRFAWAPLHAVGVQAKDRKSTRLNSSHVAISYAVFCLKKKKQTSALHTRRRRS